jgi:hypothetical protein
MRRDTPAEASADAPIVAVIVLFRVKQPATSWAWSKGKGHYAHDDRSYPSGVDRLASF